MVSRTKNIVTIIYVVSIFMKHGVQTSLLMVLYFENLEKCWYYLYFL